jgi:hypothetical protein
MVSSAVASSASTSAETPDGTAASSAARHRSSSLALSANHRIAARMGTSLRTLRGSESEAWRETFTRMDENSIRSAAWVSPLVRWSSWESADSSARVCG